MVFEIKHSFQIPVVKFGTYLRATMGQPCRRRVGGRKTGDRIDLGVGGAQAVKHLVVGGVDRAFGDV